jgi:hypothetical protein
MQLLIIILYSFTGKDGGLGRQFIEECGLELVRRGVLVGHVDGANATDVHGGHVVKGPVLSRLRQDHALLVFPIRSGHAGQTFTHVVNLDGADAGGEVANGKVGESLEDKAAIAGFR